MQVIIIAILKESHYLTFIKNLTIISEFTVYINVHIFFFLTHCDFNGELSLDTHTTCSYIYIKCNKYIN